MMLLAAFFAITVALAVEAQGQTMCPNPSMDVIYLIDRYYFTNLRYNTVVRPIMDEVTNGLSPNADVRVAFVEYGAYVNVRSSLSDYQSPQLARSYNREYKVGPNLGTFGLLGEGLETVRSQVLNPKAGHRESVPTFVVAFIGSEMYGLDEIKSETRSLKDQNVKVIVVGVGNYHEQARAEGIASSPDLHFYTDYFGSESRQIGRSLTNMFNTVPCIIVVVPATTSLVETTLPTTPLPTTTLPTTPLPTTTLPTTTLPTTTLPTTQAPALMAPNICYAPDTVFIFDRSYFDTPTFTQQAHPILQDFSKSLDPCIDIHMSFVEYNDAGLLRFPFTYFPTSADARNGLEMYTVGQRLGDAANVDDAFVVTRTQALTSEHGHRANSTTYVITFLGNNPDNESRAIEEANRLKRETGAMLIVLAFGDAYNPDFSRSLASSPSLTYPVYSYSQSDLTTVSSWLLNIIRPGFAAPVAPVTEPETTPSYLTTTELLTTTLNVTANVTESTLPPTTLPFCHSPDTVYVFQRSCFTQATFDQQVQPIIASFANQLDPCVNLYTAFVEYGSSAHVRYGYNDFKTTTDAKNNMQHYHLGNDLGAGTALDEAFRVVRGNVLRGAQSRALNNPTYVYTFLCDSPPNEMRAIDEAERLKLDGAILSVLALGNRYDPNFVRILSSSPDYFMQVGTNPDNNAIAKWMAANAALPTIPLATTPILMQTIEVVTNATESTTTVMNVTAPIVFCPARDTVYVFQRSCFDQQNFTNRVQPILSSFANRLDPCTDLYTSYVEYGSNTAIRHRYGDFKTTSDAMNFMRSYTVGDDLGSGTALDKAFSTVRTGVLRDTMSRDLRNPTIVYTFLCNNAPDEMRAISEAEQLRLDGAIVPILAFGNRYDPNFIRILANSPKLFMPVGENPDYVSIGNWMLASGGLPAVEVLVVGTGIGTGIGTGLGGAATTETPSTTITTPILTTNTTESLNTTTVSICHSHDTVYVFQRSCFNQTTFDQHIQPVLTSYARNLDPCVQMYTAYVEYGSTANVRYHYNDFKTPSDAANLMQNYRLGDDLGSGTAVNEAFETVRNNVLRDATARALNNPTYVYTFMCDNPPDETTAIEEAELLKLDGGIISILGYGNRYSSSFLRILTNSPALFMPVGPQPNPDEIARWMMYTAGLPGGFTVAPESSTTESSTTTETTTSPINATTLLEAAATYPAPTYIAPCYPMDVIFLIDRCYFTPEVFQKTIHPLFVTVANTMPSCWDLRTSIVEYSNSPNIRIYLDDFTMTSDLKTVLNNYTTYLHSGSQSDLGNAFKTVRTEVMTPQRGRRNTRAVVVVFLANDPSNQTSAVDEAELLKMEPNTVIEVIAYGNNYSVENVRILSNGHDYFIAVNDQAVIEHDIFWMLMVINGSVQPTPAPTPVPSCCTVDMIVVLDRSYFNADRFLREGRPLLLDFINKLPQCADIRVALIEYGSYVNVNNNCTLTTLREFVPTRDVGSDPFVHTAFESVRIQAIAPSTGHRRSSQAVVLLMTGSDPANEASAINEAELVKSEQISVVVFAFGNNYTSNNIRILASDPAFFFPISSNATFQNDTTELINFLCPGGMGSGGQATPPTAFQPVAAELLPELTSTLATTPVPVFLLPSNNTLANEFCFRCAGRCQHGGLYANPDDCHTFYQCFYLSKTEAVGLLSQCPPGMFFSSAISVCIPEGQTPCADVCENATVSDQGCYAMPNSCGQFFVCSNGISYQQCCPDSTSFDARFCSCTSDNFCNETCSIPAYVTSSMAPPTVVNSTTCIDRYGNMLQEYPGYPNRFVIVANNQVYSLVCAPTTKFDPIACHCVFDENATATFSSSRQALLYLPFEADLLDHSVQRFMTYPCGNNLTLADGGAVAGSNTSAYFTGSQLEIPGLKNIDLRDQASWCLFYRCPSGNCSGTGGLLSNNEGGDLYTIVIATNGSYVFSHLHTQSGQPVSLSAPVNANNQSWSQVCVVYGGGFAKLYTNGRQADSEVAPGRLALGHCNYLIGSDPTFGRFNGYIDNVLVTAHAMGQDEIDNHNLGNYQQLIQKGVLPA